MFYLHLLTYSKLRSIVGGRWIVPPGQTVSDERPHADQSAEDDARHTVTGISTDTRSIKQGEVFLALKGPNFDGHTFLRTAVAAGAGLCIIEDKEWADEVYGSGVPVLHVPSTLAALGDLAHHIRAEAGAQGGLRVVGVAGSSGKTSVKEMLAEMARQQWGDEAVLVSPANDNNLIGLPKTLLRLEAKHRVAVIEAGMNQPGELARLAEILAADIALLTNIGTAHCGQFDSLEEHFQAKAQWVSHAPLNSLIIYNGDCVKSRRALREAGGDRERTMVGGTDPRTVAHASKIAPRREGGFEFEMTLDGQSTPIQLPLFGSYQVENFLISSAAAYQLGIPAETIAASALVAEPAGNRGRVIEMAGRRLLMDCYNAAPEAMLLSLESAAEWCMLSGGRAYAVLGDMAELGGQTAEAHREIGRKAAEVGFDGVFGVGDHILHTLMEAKQGGVSLCIPCHSLEEAASTVADRTNQGDLILIKGSRGMALENLLPLLSAYWSEESAESELAEKTG